MNNTIIEQIKIRLEKAQGYYKSCSELQQHEWNKYQNDIKYYGKEQADSLAWQEAFNECKIVESEIKTLKWVLNLMPVIEELQTS